MSTYTMTQESLLPNEKMTPEKLALMKLSASDFDRDVFSDGETTVNGFGGMDKFHSFKASEGSRALARTSSRVVSSSTRRQSSFMQSHRNKMSMELTSQAESKFFSMIELMANASREASMFREYWTKLMSDRENFDSEREELLMQIEEVNETLQRKDNQHQHHGRELAERKKEVEKLLIELSAAMNSITEHKKEVTRRNQELEILRVELGESQTVVARSQMDHEKLRFDLDDALARLKTSESERDQAREKIEKQRVEIRSLTREYTEIKSLNSEITAKLESTRKDVHSLTDRLQIIERERVAVAVEKDRMQEELRKTTIRSEEISRELSSVADRFERTQRELKQSKDNMRTVEIERDDHVITIDHLRQEVKLKITVVEETEARLADIQLKSELTRRELTDKDRKIDELETEVHELQRNLDRTQEEFRQEILEKAEIKDDLETERRKNADSRDLITTLQEKLERTESTMVTHRTNIQTMTDRLRILEHERDEFRSKHGNLEREIAQYKETIALLHGEVRSATQSHDRARKELGECQRGYEEVMETVTTYKDSSSELEFEIENLRSMLRDARQQKERAIAARTAADRERDEYVAKYEEKCREMERWEENRQSYLHSHGNGMNRSSSVRVTTRGGNSSSVHHHHNDSTLDNE